MPAVVAPERAIEIIREFLASGRSFKVELGFLPEDVPFAISPTLPADEHRRALARARQKRFRDARSRNAKSVTVTRDSVTSPPDPLSKRGIPDSANRAGSSEKGDRDPGARDETTVTDNALRNASRGKRKRVRKDEIERPADMAPTAEHRARAARTGLDCDREFEKFCASTDARGVLYVSWNSGFTTWLINAPEFAASKGGSGGRPARPTDIRQRTLPGEFDLRSVLGKANGAAK